MRYIILLGCLFGGFVLIRYSKWLVDSTGIRFESLESSIGYGSTHGIIKVFGLGIILFGFWWLFQ